MTDIRELLGIKIESPYWDEAFEMALSDTEIPRWLTQDFLDMLHEEYKVLPKTYEVISSALPSVLAVNELSLFAKTLYHILNNREPFSRSFTEFEMPKAPSKENAVGYACVAVFPVLGHVYKTWRELEKRGLPKDVISSSLFWVDFLFDEAMKKSGKAEYSLDAFRPYSVGIYVNSLIIGRLRFEMCEKLSYPVRIFKNGAGDILPLMDGVRIHKSGHLLGTYGCNDEDGAYDADFAESDGYFEGYTVNESTRLVEKKRVRLNKSEWSQVYSSGMSVLKVHIPYGGKLDKEICRKSYERAREIFKKLYPEYSFSAFMLECWMLSPELCDILPKESNIISFSEPYTIYPVRNSAEDALLYVYNLENKTPADIDIPSLPENNSLQRGVKRKLESQRPIYEFGGYISF